MMKAGRIAFHLGAAALALSIGGAATSQSKAGGGAAACSAITASAFGGSSASGKWVAADAAAGLPAYCEVIGTISPVAGSQIGVVYRLPERWNGKLLGLGGGGWAGNVTLQAASEGLKKGYATAQTDGGHASTEVWDNTWASNPQARTDFAYRAIHEMTAGGKKAVAAYYGRKQQRAYYQGCSTGGRMGLMEAQRFPNDYDAIIAGAPVYSLQTQTTAVLRSLLFARPGAAFSAPDLALVHTAVLDQCDARDGLKDGLVTAPRSCGFDPAALQCTGTKTASCLAPTQVAALREIYNGVRAPDGSWAMLPMSRGGETAWSFFVPVGGAPLDAPNTGGAYTLAPYLFGDAGIDWSKFSPADAQRARTSAFAKEYEATDANLAPFFRGGGRLLMWHGEDDPGPSPVGANDYAERVVKANSGGGASRFRHFLLPGTGHCGGGPGAFQVDWLDELDKWSNGGSAPDTVIGKRPDGPMVRKHCAWPKVAHYMGKGEPNDPSNWKCMAET